MAYVRDHEIESVVFFHDFTAFVAAIVCQETGLPGPGIESSFLCVHKYYSRQVEPSALWIEAIELDKDDWSMRIKYPCCIKPPCMFLSVGIFIVNNEKEMKAALESCRKEVPQWNNIWRSLFEKYIDTKKYPLALKDMVIAEEAVQSGMQHTIEGWVDGEGRTHIWLTSDEGYFTKPQRTLEGYFMPTQVPQHYVKSMEEVAVKVASNHLLRNTFFNVEVWCCNGGKKVVVTEINNRVAYVYHNLYLQVYGTSNVYAALLLACGKYKAVLYMSSAFTRRPPANLVGGLFFVQVHLQEEEKASDVIDFQAAKSIQKEASDTSEPDVMSNHGPGIDIVVEEDSILYPLGSFGVLVATFNIFKPTFSEVIKKAEEIRKAIIKRQDILPHSRETEYYLSRI